MRTVRTQDILWSVARKMGVDPHTVLNENISNALLGYIDDRAREIWEMYDWQDLVTYEQRAYADDVDGSKNYTQGDIVYDPATDAYYQSALGGQGLPADFPEIWTKLALGFTVNSHPFLQDVSQGSPTVIPAYIPFAQPNKGTIDTVFYVFATDPRLTGSPIPLSYSVTSRGIELRKTHRTTAWVVYRAPFPGVGIEIFDSTNTYAIGDGVYESGESWISLTDGNLAHDPVTDDGSHWSKLRLPYVLRDYIVGMAYGDALLEDGQNDKAQAQWSIASSKAVNQFEKQQTQQGQTTFYDVIVHRR